MEMSKKKLLAITLALTTFLAMFAAFGPIVVSTQYINVDRYCWIEGVLHNDTYLLYPYARKSLDFGFSKYGEMIGYNEDTKIGLGLQYPGYSGAADPDLAPLGTYDQRIGTSVDPFCNEKIGVDWWMNGWFIDIKYTPLGGEENREIWAFALFSDGSKHGGDWIVMPSVAANSPARPLWQENPPYANPASAAYSGIVTPIPESGGRKTNGYCETDPLEIIYNGPRRFIAISRTKISDVGAAAELVDLTFTFIFNKAEKNVIILKDVKRLYAKSDMNIQFGNRGEWDLGIYPATDSYIHWYTDEPVQYWDQDGLGTITLTEEKNSFEFFKSYFLEYKYPKKWWDEVPADEIPTSVCDEWTESMRAFPGGRYTNDISWNETQPTCYGREWHYDQTIKEHSYAVAQVITKAGDYVGAVAVWPHPEFWAAHNLYYPPKRTTVAGGGLNPSSLSLMLTPISRLLEWHKWTVTEDPISGDYPYGYLADRDDVWVKMDDVVYATGGTKEPIIPFTIYEHDFWLKSDVPSYRIVSVYMLTDRHDADDRDALRGANAEDWSNGVNWIDREIQYQLDEIFNPWDIYDAMHKNTKSWVQFFNKGVATPTTPWTSPNIKAWDGEKYHCIQLDSEREIEVGKEIPCLPVYPGTEPRVRPNDYVGHWDDDHGLCWDAYCAFTERVLVNSGTGYELIPRGITLDDGEATSTSYVYGYHWLDPTPVEIDEYPEDRRFYTIDFNTGRICFYEFNAVTKVFEEWYLPVGSMVKVLWSSEHHETTADQWDEDDLWEYDYELDQWEYAIDGENFRFPLHHDIISEYKPDTEVFLVEQPPEQIFNVSKTDGTPWYAWSARSLTVCNVSKCKEVDVKYWNGSITGADSWIEEKFHSNGSVTQTFTLSGLSPTYIKKVWIHSEKALVGGDYVFNNATKTIYMQDPVPYCQWLLVNYTANNGAIRYANFFHGDGSKTAFTLRAYPDVGSLNVSNTETLQQIVNYTTAETPLGIRVPREDCYWNNVTGGNFANKTWERFGVWEEREWLNVTDTKVRGNWIIRETSTCDELVLDQPPLNQTQTEDGWPGQELKIVFKVPSGRYEWGTIGKNSAPEDSLGNTMVVAAFKNKLIEFGIGGLDIQSATYGPRMPWLIDGTISPDNIGRYHLYDDWCYSRTLDADSMDRSWPISSSNIITVGGTAVNNIAKYFNDFGQAMSGTTVGSGYYAVTCWDKDLTEYGFYASKPVTDRYGYAVIQTFKDKNGTIVFLVRGWNAQDTYYACKWFDEHKFELQHLNLHVTDLILRVEYKKADGTLRCPPIVTIREKLGTISEKPQHDCP